MTDQLLGVRDRPDRLRGVGVSGAAVALDYLNVGTPRRQRITSGGFNRPPVSQPILLQSHFIIDYFISFG